MENQSRFNEFLLHGFPTSKELRILHIIAFLIIYWVAVSENLIIITVIVYSHHLHSPMYFFLANLSLQDLGSISVTVPKSMLNSVMNTETISYFGCVFQAFFFVFFLTSHFFLLGIMAYDRYVAICNPLHYETVMNKKVCIQMITGALIAGLFYSTLFTGNLFTVKFCSRIIGQFFCEVPQLLKISCSDSYLAEEWALIFGTCSAFIIFALILFSYVKIFTAVLQIPSTQGKQKAFTTCLPHLFVICLFMVSGAFVYMRPTTTTITTTTISSSSSSVLDLLISIFYSVVPPVMNPLIYSMRNKELKMAFWRMILNISTYPLCRNCIWFQLF